MARGPSSISNKLLLTFSFARPSLLRPDLWWLQLTNLLSNLKASGALAESTTILQLSHCVYGRMNTHLYEYRPKVIRGGLY